MKAETPKKTISFDPVKCDAIYTEIVEVFKKYKPTIGEIIIAYGNLGYTLGASIEGYKDKGPNVDELEKLYYSEPGKIGIALMLNGTTVCTWYDDLVEQIKKNSEEEL